jgi:hypothetical protein
MRAAAAVRAEPGVEPSVYLTSGCKTYPVDLGWTPHATPSHVKTMKSTIKIKIKDGWKVLNASTIDKRLQDDRCV